MAKCMFDIPAAFPFDLTVEAYNEERQRHHAFMKAIAAGRVRLMCNRCGQPTIDQNHTDFTMEPPMRQVVCSNPGCNKTDYRME